MGASTALHTLLWLIGSADIAVAFLSNAATPQLGTQCKALQPSSSRPGICPIRTQSRGVVSMLGAADKNLPRAGDAGGLGQWLGGLVKGTGRNNNEQTEQRRRDCKRRLAAAVAQKQSAESRQNVEELLEELVAIGGTPGGLESQDLSGRWVLAWSSQTADAWPFALPSEVLGGDCFQDIDKAPGAGIGRVCNIVDWPALGMTLRGGAALETVNATRSIIRIDSFTLEIGPLSLPLLSLTNSSGFEITANDAPKVRSGSQLVSVKRKAGSQLTGAGTGTRVLNKREGYLDMLYIDAAGARLTRGENNLLYLHVREGAALC